jgi:two-component system CheB/CheR fusion protein
MQSTNEELTTVNEELHNRMAELSQTNDDLNNVLAGIDVAVIMVGMDLRIRRYTAAAEKLFHLVAADLGRPIDLIDPFLVPSKIGSKVSTVIQTLSSLEEDVLVGNQRWHALRIIPYKTLDLTIRGSLITLTDIDIRKRAKETIKEATAYAATALAAISHPLLIVDKELRIIWANANFFGSFRLSRDEALGSLLPELGGGQFMEHGLLDLVKHALSEGTLFRDYRVRFRFPDIGERIMKTGGSGILTSQDNPLVLLSIEPNGIAREDTP